MLVLWIILNAAVALPPYAVGPQPPVEVGDEDPFAWEAHYDAAAARIVATLTIPPTHTVYRDQVEVSVVSAGAVAVGKPDLPKGELRDDPAGHEPRELYATDLVVYIPVKRGEGPVELELAHQGCRPGLCFPPATARRVVEVRALRPAAE